MAPERDWVDYANLASNIARNVQLRDVQHKLGAVASAMGTVASAIQEEKDTADREHKLREAVFQAESMLRTLQKISKENKRASLAWARHNLLQFQSNEVTSASFRTYEDKERWRTTIAGHEQLIEECAIGLSPQQKDQAERCGQYLMERDDLNLLIRLAPGEEELVQLMADLAPLAVNAKSSLARSLVAAWMGLGILGVIMFYAYLLVAGNGIGYVMLLVAGTVFFSWLVSCTARATSQQAAKNSIEAELAGLLRKEPLLDPAFGLVMTLRGTFGNASAAELIKMRNDREGLIAQVIGEAKTPAKASGTESSPPGDTNWHDVRCPHCGTEWELDDVEAQQKEFLCSDCNHSFPIVLQN